MVLRMLGALALVAAHACGAATDKVVVKAGKPTSQA